MHTAPAMLEAAPPFRLRPSVGDARGKDQEGGNYRIASAESSEFGTGLPNGTAEAKFVPNHNH